MKKEKIINCENCGEEYPLCDLTEGVCEFCTGKIIYEDLMIYGRDMEKN